MMRGTLAARQARVPGLIGEFVVGKYRGYAGEG
jgi:hypothetical protein